MKKNITSILQRGNITPKKRVLLLVADEVSQERDGKALLTEADKHALSEGWTPKDNNEVSEYNLYTEGRKNIAFGELDAQTTYLQATNGFLRASKYTSYIIQKDRHNLKNKSLKNDIANSAIDNLLKKYDIDTIKEAIEGDAIKKEITKTDEALNLVLGYLGLELDDTIYFYAFELAGEELQRDLLALYPDAKTERGYLEQEETIFNLFTGKNKLSKEVFKKWLEVKAKATETIQGLIDKDELKTEKRDRVFKNFKGVLGGTLLEETDQTGQDETIKDTKTIITGESLYNLKGDFNFVKDLREQAEDFKIFGALVLFLRECSFVKNYATLLGFLELYKRISKVYDIDLTYKIKDYIKKFRDDLEGLKIEFLMLGDDIAEANYKGDRVYYLSESYIEDLLAMPFDPDSVKPDTDNKLKVYFDAFKKLFGDDF